MKHYDYTNSIDARIVHETGLLEDKELVLFLRQLDNFVKESINKCCEGFSEDEHSFQMQFDYKNIISEINSTPDICILISIPVKSEKLNEGTCLLLSDFLRDRVFLSQYSKKKEMLTLVESGEVDNRRVYTCTLHSSYVQRIKTDEDYE